MSAPPAGAEPAHAAAPVEPAPGGAGGLARLRRLAAPAALAAVVVAPFATVLAGRHTVVARDTAQLAFPVRELVTEALREGRLPLWNPHEGLGKPLLADLIHGVLHPLSLLAAAVDPGGVDLLAVLHVLSAALGAWVLCRELGLSRAASFAGGAGYALSGYVLSMGSSQLFLLAGASCLPWQVAALAAAGRGAPLAVPAAALATACGIFSADAQGVAVGAALGAALAVERGGRRGLGRGAAGIALGALVAGIQLVPTLAHMARSTRSGGIDAFEQRIWALSPWRLVELVVPGLFYRQPSDASAAVYEWLDAGGKYLPYGASVYLGVPLLALGAAAPFRERRVRVLAAAAAVLLWLALGHHLGARQLLAGVPVWGAFRYTEKLVVPLSLALALLAAHGLAGAGGAGPDRRRIALGAAVLAAVPVAAWAAAALLPASAGPAAALEALRANLADGVPRALAGAAALAVALAVPRPALRPPLAAAAVAAALLAAFPRAIHLGDPAAIVRSPLAGLPAEPPGVRVTVPDYRLPTRPGLDDVDARNRGLSALGVAAWNVRDRVDALESYGPFDPSRWVEAAGPIAPERWVLFRHWAGTHVVLQEPLRPGQPGFAGQFAVGGRLVHVDRDVPAYVYAVPHRPWAVFAGAGAVHAVPDAAASLARVRENMKALRDEVVIEAPAPVPAAPGKVLALHRGVEDLAVDVLAAGEALLVVNDAFWPGWVAEVDGVETPILPADALVRAVRVPPGPHRITMRYAPEEVRYGWGLTAIGLLTCLAVALPRRGRA